MSYLKIGMILAIVSIGSGAIGYVLWLRSSLTAARAEISSLVKVKERLEGDLANARTRAEIEDAIRTDPDAERRLRERYSRPE